MKMKKLEKFQKIVGLKGFKWSCLNAGVSLRLGEFNFPIFSILLSEGACRTPHNATFAESINERTSFQIFKGHTGAVTCMSVDATGKILYTAGADACIKSWNIATGQMLKVGQGNFATMDVSSSVHIGRQRLQEPCLCRPAK